MGDPDSASLEANMEDHITASLGPMVRLLRRLHSFEASQQSLPEGLSTHKIKLLEEGLEVLYTYLKDAPEAEDPSCTPKWWIEEVRELSYDTEDYVDEVMDSGAGVRRSARLSTIFRIISKRKRRPQTAKDFSQLMSRVDDARERRKSFKLAPETIRPDSGQAGVSCLTPKLSLELPVSAASISVHVDTDGGRSIVGVEEPMSKLVNLLAFDDTDQKQLKVIPIFGSACVGKTTLARTLYHKFGGKFQCRAFLRVSRNPDMRRLLTSMLSQIKAPPRALVPSDAQDLIDSITKHLGGKRYFIIIDDLWTASAWNIISRALPDDNCGSRIITTTQIEDVALACCGYQSEYIIKMGPLNDGESRKLFFSSVFGSEGQGGCPKDFETVAGRIIRKCGGLPLSIVNIASLLSSKPKLVMEQWENVQRSVPSTLGTNPTSEGMKDVLILIYNNLPPHLKTCLLYLSMYPEGYTIRKDDLVKQWVAEGFVGDIEHVARGYFDELVRRGMIQPVDTNYNGEVLSCTVNQTVLDLIRYKSMEDNFIIAVDYFESTPGLPHKVRRLSVQFGGAKSAKIPESIRMSQVRSLLFCGFFKCVPSIVDYRLLQVLILDIWADQLDIWADQDEASFDLTIICELFRLRYLKIECNITVDLPDKIQGLQHLRTLQIDARLSAVPSDIGHLEKLLHLRLPGQGNLPAWIGHLTSLRSLGYFNLSNNSRDNVLGLGKLINLWDLRLTCSTVKSNTLVGNMKHLGSILGKFSKLQSLILDSGASSLSISCDGLSSVSPVPVLLERLELPRVCIFPSLPKWIGELGKLCILKIAVSELSREGFHILKELPALTALSLYVWTAPAEWILFREGFGLLKYFKFMCPAPCMSFMEGAMPNVRKIKLGFSANRMKQNRPVTFGFRHLKGLREISINFGGAGADVSDKAAYLSDMAAAVKHPVNVKFVDRTFFGEQDKSSRISTKPESSSRMQNPEHKTVTVVMGDGTVSASTGAMYLVLKKLAALMGDEYPKLKGKQEEVMHLKEELGAMNTLLEQLADVPELNMEMKGLRNQMREMTYAVEDCIDDLMLTGYPEKRDMLRHLILEIWDLRGRVGKADLPSMAHTTEIQTLPSSYKATESGWLHTLYNKAIGLVGIDGPRDELVRRMNGAKRKLQVACILGSSGLGKTTLATEVYSHIKRTFDHRVFIQVPQKIDITRLHKIIIRQLSPQDEPDYQYMDVADYIHVVRRYLRHKRYLIVIDGVWSAQTWEVVKSALPNNNRGSRILMTTDVRDIAESCNKHSSGFIYFMQPLTAQDSLSLLKSILFGSERSCPVELEKVAERILVVYGGIPMAIIIMAGILASIPVEVAEGVMVAKRMEPAGDGDPSKEMIRKMFDISYSSLPRDLKSCLLYLSVFRENYFGPIRNAEISYGFYRNFTGTNSIPSRFGKEFRFPNGAFVRKDRLIWRWIAEGFLPKKSEESLWETGERYFLELIARNLIEPVYEEDDNEVPVGCKVHGLILEFIASLSNEENFVTTSAEATHMQHDVTRRLIVSNQEEDPLWRLTNSGHWSKLRSITILEDDQGENALILPSEPFLFRARFLRVLDLEDLKSLREYHLMGIEELVLLSYLGLGGTGIRQLPEEIGELQQLETLDLRRTRLWTLPASIASLRKLVRLLLEPHVELPREIREMQDLEEISTVDAHSSSSLNSVARLLFKSKPLRMLDVIFGRSYGRDGDTTKTHRRDVISFLSEVGNSNLQSLSLCFDSDGDVGLLRILLYSWEVCPRHFRRFKLELHLQGAIPPQMASLVNITHLDIKIPEVQAEGVRILGDLPNLVLLTLIAGISRRCVIGGEGFQCLKVFTLSCSFVEGLKFTPGAMPQLRRLRLYFTPRESSYGDYDFGIQHLSWLTRVHATIDCDGATISEVEALEAAIRRPVYELRLYHSPEFAIKPTVEFIGRLHLIPKGKGTINTFLKKKVNMKFLQERQAGRRWW